jgi:hypothetical protein
LVEEPNSRWVPINAARSDGRCNTIYCFDSTMLAWEKWSVWLSSVKNLARVVFPLI